MKHYVVISEWASGGESGFDIIGIAHFPEEAKEIFDGQISKEKEIAEDGGYEIIEDSDTCFDAGETGFYDSEHVSLYIKEVVS